MTPRFSVVVPSRDRPRSLPFTIRSVLEQGFEDFELVVCENSTTDEPAKVIAGFRDPRLRVVHTGGGLSMARNWELALSRCTGEFVTFLGDDDAFLPHGLAELDRVLRRTGARALRWDIAIYTWPEIASSGDANILFVPTARALVKVDGRARCREVCSRPFTYPLPVVYHGAVERRLLEELRAASGGALFRGVFPDVHSGFAVGLRVGEFWESSVPLTVGGLSGTSTGVSVLADHAGGSRSDPIRQAFTAMNERDGVTRHPSVAALRTMPAIVFDSWAVARDVLAPDEPPLDPRHVARALLDSITTVEPLRRSEEVALVRAALARQERDVAWFDRLASTRPPAPTLPLMPTGRGAHGDHVILDLARLPVQDVAAAATLTGSIVGLGSDPVRYDRPTRAGLVEARDREKVAPLQQERDALLASLSWRLTAPLRMLGAVASRLRREAVSS